MSKPQLWMCELRFACANQDEAEFILSQIAGSLARIKAIVDLEGPYRISEDDE